MRKWLKSNNKQLLYFCPVYSFKTPTSTYMNSANFHQYLRNPSMLHQVNYQELKSLVLQYPYAPNLRYLMLAKSLLEGQREYDRNLVLASLGSIDRRKLRQLVFQYSHLAETTESSSLSEDFLELKDLSALEDIMEVASTEAGTPKAVAIDSTIPDSSSIEFLDDLTEVKNEPTLDIVEPETAAPVVLEDLLPDEPVDNPVLEIASEPINDLEGLPEAGTGSEIEAELNTDAAEAITSAANETLEVPTTIEDVGGLEIEESAEGLFEEAGAEIPQEAKADTTKAEAAADQTTPPIGTTRNEPQPMPAPSPSPKSAFNSYKKQMRFNRPGLLSGSLDILPKKPAPQEVEEKIPRPAAPVEADPPLKETYEPPADIAREVAAKSVSEDSSIATETLAGILARQGHFDKAIKMYEKLSLQFPEKSDTFAAKIKELKRK